MLLDRLLHNLVHNAIRHNHRGGWIEVRTALDDGQAVATVRNSGDAIPPADVGRLFEPFQRLAVHRTNGSASTGLGLAIVRSIVSAHAGTVSAVPNPGGGLSVTVALPAPQTLLAPVEHRDEPE